MVPWDGIFEHILSEYYDHMIDTTDMSAAETFETIQRECENL